MDQTMSNFVRVLYIEDNPDNRLLVQRVLVAEGFAVDVAANAADGVKLAETGRPDLILVDINMPDVDGYTVTAQLRKMDHMSRVPIIALTANVMKGDKEKTLAAGCDGYIQKPIDIDQFPRQLTRFVQEAKAL
jgi:two-component system cell cycle response regulator DivK